MRTIQWAMAVAMAATMAMTMAACVEDETRGDEELEQLEQMSESEGATCECSSPLDCAIKYPHAQNVSYWMCLGGCDPGPDSTMGGICWSVIN